MSVYLEAYSNPWALLWTISTTLRAGSGCAVGGERQVCVCVTGLRKVKVEDEGNVKLFRSSYFFSPSTIVQANVRFEQARQDRSIHCIKATQILILFSGTHGGRGISIIPIAYFKKHCQSISSVYIYFGQNTDCNMNRRLDICNWSQTMSCFHCHCFCQDPIILSH